MIPISIDTKGSKEESFERALKKEVKSKLNEENKSQDNPLNFTGA